MSGDQHRTEPVAVSHVGSRQTVLWIIAMLLAVIATAMVLRLDESSMSRSVVRAQVPGGAGRLGARGIYAFAGQVTRNSYGIFMLDVDTGTIWCYELSGGTEGAKQLRLVAARSWVFDRYLEEFNVGDPTPAAVADLVEKQVSQRQRLRKGDLLNGPADTQPVGQSEPEGQSGK